MADKGQMNAVGGLSASILASSDEVFEFYCQPCDTENHHIEAAGYCVQCCEYLCDNCSKCHGRLSATKHHTLLDKATMPKTQMKPGNDDVVTSRCPRHVEKLLEYFCSAHDQLCCSHCVNKDHGCCRIISNVSAVSSGTAVKQQYTDVMSNLDKLISEITCQQKRIDMSSQDNDKYYSKALSNIQEFKEQVIEVLDNLQEDTVRKLSKLNQDNSDKLKIASDKFQTMLSDVKDIKKDMEAKAKAKKNNQLFVEMKLTQQRIAAMEDGIKDQGECTIARYEFRIDEKMQEMMSILSSILSLSVRQDGAVTKARYLEQVSVRSADDKKNCGINGIVAMSRGRMVVSDFHNKAIKLVDLKLNRVTSRLPVASDPLDLTKTGEDQVAVVLGVERKIEFFSVSDVLSKSHTVDVPGDGFTGLCFDHDRLILVYDYTRAVKTADMSGRILATVYKAQQDDKLFNDPRYIALSRDGNVVYVSDREANTVTTMTLSGHVISVYKHDLISYPLGAAVGSDGSVYVCSSKAHTLHQLSPSGEGVQVILDTDRDLAFLPMAIDYSEEDDRLYISSDSTKAQYCDYIRLFQLE